MKNKKIKKIFIAIIISIAAAMPVLSHEYPALKASTASSYSNLFYYIFSPVNAILPSHYFRKVIYETQSSFSEIRVYEDSGGYRYLVFLPENGYQSAVDINNLNILVLEYTKLAFISLPALGRVPEKVLFVGMGGAVMPSYFRNHYLETKIDIVEIDETIPAIAETYLGFNPDSNTGVYIEDGRAFIESTKNKYDIIFIDVYDAETIPEQFTTPEFFGILKERLNSSGVLSVNLANLSPDFVSAIYHSVKYVFPQTFSFLTENTSNYMLIALENSKFKFDDLARNSVLLDSSGRFNISFQKMLERQIQFQSADYANLR